MYVCVFIGVGVHMRKVNDAYEPFLYVGVSYAYASWQTMMVRDAYIYTNFT